MAKPDSSFFEEIKKKELWLFEVGKNTKDFENAPTVESLEQNVKDSNKHQSINPSQFKIHISKAKSIEIDADGRFEISDDEDYKSKEITKTFDDYNLGSKSKPMKAADFSGGGSDDFYPMEDIFEILCVPDCGVFYMTGFYNCNTLSNYL